MSTPRIQVLIDDVDLAPEVLDALDLVGAAVELRRLNLDEPKQADHAADARLVVTSDSHHMVNGKLKELRRWLDTGACATLVYSDITNQRETPETLGEPTCTVGFASNLSRDALAGQLTAMCRHRSTINAMQRELTTLRATERSMRTTILIKKGSNLDFGARPLRRALENYIEDTLSEDLLKGEFEGKDTIVVGCKTVGDKKQLIFEGRLMEPKEPPVGAVADGGGESEEAAGE